MRSEDGTEGRHPSYVQSLAKVQLAWDTTGPFNLKIIMAPYATIARACRFTTCTIDSDLHNET